MFFFCFTYHCIWERMWNFYTNYMLPTMISIVSNTKSSLKTGSKMFDPILLQVDIQCMKIWRWISEMYKRHYNDHHKKKKKTNWNMISPHIFLLLVHIISFVDNLKPYTNSLHIEYKFFHYATLLQTYFK